MSPANVVEKRQVRTCANGHSWIIKRITELRYGMSYGHTEGELMCPECHGIAIASVDYPPKAKNEQI